MQKGSVEFFKKLDGENVLVGSVGQGSIFGEMALINDQPRMATAIVAEPTVCIVISEALFQRKLKVLDPFLAGVLRILVENIRSIQDQKMKGAGAASASDAEAAAVGALMDQLVVSGQDDDDDDAFEVA